MFRTKKTKQKKLLPNFGTVKKRFDGKCKAKDCKDFAPKLRYLKSVIGLLSFNRYKKIDKHKSLAPKSRAQRPPYLQTRVFRLH